jgi:DNA-directed RNA polymerase subunit RPC12/RpoP
MLKTSMPHGTVPVEASSVHVMMCVQSVPPRRHFPHLQEHNKPRQYNGQAPNGDLNSSTMAGRKAQPLYHCGMCDKQFRSKADLNAHIKDHADSGPAQLVCPVCNWPFEDSLSLEDHKIKNGHDSPRFTCQTCGKGFVTPRMLDEHKKRPFTCSLDSTGGPVQTRTSHQTDKNIACDRCSKKFRTRHEYDDHRSFKSDSPCADHNHKTSPRTHSGYRDPDTARNPVREMLGYAESDDEEAAGRDDESEAPTNLSDGELWCSTCRNRFASLARYNIHTLWCVTKHGSDVKATLVSRTPDVKETASVRQSEVNQFLLSPKLPREHRTEDSRESKQSARPSPAPSASPSATAGGDFPCNVCQRASKSEAGLKQHKLDAHGIGGRGLDLAGKDSWMLIQRAREQMKADSLLRPPPTGPSRRGEGGRGRGGRGGQVIRAPPPGRPQQHQRTIAMPGAPQYFTPATIPAFGAPPSQHMPFRHPPPQMSNPAPVVLPMGINIGGTLEMEQAKQILGKVLRLLIQSDIFIHHDGKMTVCGVGWSRIAVQKQPDVIGMFDAMCHLPKVVQHEYLPPPKAYSSDYQQQYPASEFEPSPARDPAKPGLDVVAFACTSVELANGLQEVVKVAAVDLVTCRILMNHLVCSDATAPVKDWRSLESGLFSWNDMEQARKLGYKVFKGWFAARSALWKFIDKDTIIIGHNLRADLDALRMVHGRAVDIAKVAEKAAKGPLSKAQLGLDSLCRDFLAHNLKNDPEYGRDVLMNAFASREIGLRIVKYKDEFERKMEQKSTDYQRVMPRNAAA